MIEAGTRTRATRLSAHPAGGSLSAKMEQDPGMSKRFVGGITLSTGGTIVFTQAATAFAAQDVLVVQGGNLNCGNFLATAVTNNGTITTVTVDPKPKAETISGGMVRTT
jgi:hypothetical protein